MDADVMEKEKGSLFAEPEKSSGPIITHETALPRESKPQPDPKVASGLMNSRRLQEEAQAREKKLMAELEEQHILLSRKMEESFVLREKKLLEDFQARHEAERRELEEAWARKEKLQLDGLLANHMAECRRIEQAAIEREHALRSRLDVVRRQRSAAVIVAILGIAAALNFRSVSKDGSRTIPLTEDPSQAALPHSADALVSDPAAHSFAFAVVANVPAADSVGMNLPEVASEPFLEAEPAPAPEPRAAAVVKGNGGNFSGGNLY